MQQDRDGVVGYQYVLQWPDSDGDGDTCVRCAKHGGFYDFAQIEVRPIVIGQPINRCCVCDSTMRDYSYCGKRSEYCRCRKPAYPQFQHSGRVRNADRQR